MISLGAAAFWISLAAVLIASGWFKSRSEAQKHETLRRIIDKTGSVDQARLAELFGCAAPPSGWTNPELWKMPVSPPGQNRKNARITGAVVLSIAAAMTVLFLILGEFAVTTQKDTWIGLAIAAAIAVFGVGLFFTALLAEPPPKGAKDGAGTAT
jgi:hypothetical protein